MCSGKESCFPRKPSVWGIGSCPSHGGGSVGEHTKRCRKRAPRRSKNASGGKIQKKNAENLLSSYGTIEDIQIRYEVYANSVRADAEITMAERIEEKKQNIETENQNEEKEQENANEL